MRKILFTLLFILYMLDISAKRTNKAIQTDTIYYDNYSDAVTSNLSSFYTLKQPNDEMHQDWYKEYDKQNVLRREYYSLNDNSFLQTWYPNGKIESNIVFINKTKEIKAKSYWKSGELKTEELHVHDLLFKGQSFTSKGVDTLYIPVLNYPVYMLTKAQKDSIDQILQKEKKLLSKYKPQSFSFIINTDGSINHLQFDKKQMPEIALKIQSVLSQKWDTAIFNGEKVRVKIIYSIQTQGMVPIQDKPSKLSFILLYPY